MITKEEAKKIEALCGSHEMLDDLYDSIGSCGECDRFKNYTEGGDYGDCFLSEQSPFHKTEYCSRFERKV